MVVKTTLEFVYTLSSMLGSDTFAAAVKGLDKKELKKNVCFHCFWKGLYSENFKYSKYSTTECSEDAGGD
eukprot:6848000-Pyramimonas_sp.AAC.1